MNPTFVHLPPTSAPGGRAGLRHVADGPAEKGHFDGVSGHGVCSFRRVRRLSLCLVVASLAVVAVDPADAWIRRITGTRVTLDDAVVATVPDSRGNVVTVTFTSADAGGCRVRVGEREAGTGRLLWERYVGACSPSPTLAVDANDDLVLGLARFVVVKLDGRTGSQLWQATPPEVTGWVVGDVNGLAVDAAGDVVAVGAPSGDEDNPTDSDFGVEKLRGDTGALVWDFFIDGIPPPCDPNVDFCEDVFSTDAATAVALDAGRVLVAGRVQNGTDSDFTVVALDDASGGELWRHVEPGAATAIAAGDVVYAGGTTTPSGQAIVVELDPGTGVPQWTQTFGDVSPTGNRLAAMALHRSGDVLVAGTAESAGVLGVFAARLGHAQGRVVWRQDLPYPAATLDKLDTVALATDLDADPTLLASTSVPGSPSLVTRLDGNRGTVRWTVSFPDDARPGRLRALVAVGKDGDVVVGGEVRTSPSNGDSTLLRLANHDGGVRWRVEEQGAFNGEDDGVRVRIDAAGDIFVAGQVENGSAAGFSMIVAKLARTGQILWRSEVDGSSEFFPESFDYASDLVLDSAGNPIAAGTVGTPDFDDDAAVVKFDGATGAEQWRTLLHTPGVSDRDNASSVVTDAHDDAVVMAFLRDAHGAQVPTIVSLDGTTGAERWRRAMLPTPPSSFGVTKLAVAADGSIVAGAAVFNGITQRFDAVIVALDPDTGLDRWRHTLPDGYAEAVGTDAAGRVVLASRSSGAPQGSDAIIVVFDATGKEIRRTVVTTPDLQPAIAGNLAFDAAGGVVVAGSGGPLTTDGFSTRSFVTRVDADGNVTWQHTVEGAPGQSFAVSESLAVGPDDGVVGGFTTVSRTTGLDVLLVGLAGASGAERWRQVVDGDDGPADPSSPFTSPDFDAVRDVTITPQGDVVAVAVTEWNDTGKDLTVIDLVGRSGRDRRPPKWGRCKTLRTAKPHPRLTLVCDAPSRANVRGAKK
jgi:outer membrane protein assembly factor BamB